MSDHAVDVFLTLIIMVMSHAGMMAIVHPKMLALFIYSGSGESPDGVREQSADAPKGRDSNGGAERSTRLGPRWIPAWGAVTLVITTIGTWEVFPRIARGVDPTLVSLATLILLAAAFLLSFSISPVDALRRVMRKNGWLNRHVRYVSFVAVVGWLCALAFLLCILFGWPLSLRS